MHIALLCEYPSLNGGERSLLSVLDQLNQTSDWQFTALAPPHGRLADELQRRRIPVVPFQCLSPSGQRIDRPLLLETLDGILRELQPDILHANSLSMSRLAGALTRTTVSSRNAIRQQHALNPTRPLRCGHVRDIVQLSAAAIHDLNQLDGLVAVSQATRRQLVSQGLHADRCAVIHNGVDTSLFTLRGEQREQVRQRILQSFGGPPVPSDAWIVLSVGQICLRKGQQDAARAMLQTLSVHQGRPLHWVVVGERYSSKQESVEYEQSLQNEFASRNWSDRLHMTGFRDDVHDLMAAADVLVHAARQEPFGRVLLEAAASGLPIIATDVGGTSEMLIHDVHALLVPPRDAEILTASLMRLIQDPQLARALAHSARTHVQQHLTVQRSAEHLAEFWKVIADNPSRSTG